MKLEVIGLRLSALAAAIAATVALSACQQPGEAGSTTAYDVTQGAETEEIAEALERDGRVALQGGLVFQTDSATLSPQGVDAAARIAEAMQRNPALTIAVVGHTDSTGDFRYNLALSERRAQSMVDAVVANGVALERLAPVGVGPIFPAAANDTDQGRQQNRRLVIIAAG